MATSDPGDVDYKISYWTSYGQTVEKKDGHLTISFKHGLMFSGHIVKEIGIEHLRWISSKIFFGLSDLSCIIVSYLDNVSKEVANIFFELEPNVSAKCLNTMKELLTIKYEGCADTLEKVNEVITMATNQPIFTGRTEMTVHTAEEGKIDVVIDQSPGETSEYLMIIDIECMCLYRGGLDKPEHMLMFWEEETVNSIERVKLTNRPKPGSLPEKVIFFQTKTKSVCYVADSEIIKHLQTLTAKKRHLMTDPQLMLDVVPRIRMPASYPIRALPSAGPSQIQQGATGGSGLRCLSPDEEIAGRLTRELENAVATFSTNEDMQVMWIANEFDIKEIIDGGTTPSTDYRSGGMDCDSGEHLEKALQDVIDQLRENNFPIAISRIQACRDLFGSSSVPAIRHIFDTDDVQLLKSLYFKSLCG